MSASQDPRERALEAIRTVVGPRGIVDEAADCDGYLVDQRGLYRGAAALIVRPASTAEVAQILRLCNDARIGVVPQGGNTGYCGGATPDDPRNEILLSLSRMNRIREIDPVAFTMTVDAGVVLARAQAAADEHDLLFPLSMGSEGSCQIGGNLSTNAGGLAVLRYGCARDLVLGLEVVLPDGDVLHELKGLRKDNTGYDLRSLFVGAEGTLGVITAAVLKLFPAPRDRQTAFVAVPGVRAACDLLARTRRESGDAVTSFEYISRDSLALVLRHVDGVTDPLGSAAEHYVLLELSAATPEGPLGEVVQSVLESAMEAGEVLDGVVAQSGQQRDQLWRIRESIPEAERHVGGGVKHDVSVRISALPGYVEAGLQRLTALTECRVSLFGHIGDGNLHFNLIAPEGTDAAAWQDRHGSAITEIVHGLAVEMGGSFSAEHGIGKLKRAALAEYEDATALALMRRLKAALDPRGIMNPGKVL